MARHLVVNAAGITFRRQAGLAFVAMAYEQKIITRLIAEPTNQYDKHAVRIEMATEGRPDEFHFIGYIPRTHSQFVATTLLGKPHTITVQGFGTVKNQGELPWFRIAIEYEVAGKRQSRKLVADFAARLLAATDQATVEAIKGEVLAAKDRILPDQLDALRSAYISTLHRLRREQAEVGKGVD